jgi:hypothetical protein
MIPPQAQMGSHTGHLQKAPACIHRFLYDCYLDVLSDKPMPCQFNESFLIFLPKGEVDADSFHTARTPDTTRPLNWSNTMAKLVAAAINCSLSALAARTVVGQQRGFVKGRCLVDNVIEVDDFLIRAAKYYRDKHGFVLLDIRAAFPSLRQQWMFYVLSEMQIPAFTLNAIKLLYTNCKADILFNGDIYDGIHITAGIKQGCPASGSIFALALDPFIRNLILQIPPTLNLVVAFADDIAIATRTLLKILPIILREFRRLGHVAALHLNMSKVKLIPFWNNGKFETRRCIVDSLVDMQAAEVCLSGTLLGVLLGPEASQSVLTPAAHKFWHRAPEARGLNRNFKHSLRHYSVYAFLVLSYIIQYAAISGNILAQESPALQLLARTPWKSVPADALQHLRELHFSYEAPSIARSAMAATFRAAVRSAEFQRLRMNHAPPHEDLDQLVYPRSPEWVEHSPLTHMIRVFNQVNQLFPDLPPDPLTSLQHRLLSLIRGRASSPWFALLKRRLLRFDIDFCDEEFQTCLTNVGHQGSEAKDRIRWATLLVILSAIPNAARMQLASRCCLLCSSPEDDHVEHLIHCPAMAQVLAESFPVLCQWMGPALGTRRVLGLLALSPDNIRDSFAFTYIMVELHRLRRHGSVNNLLSTAQAIFRALARRHSG